MDFGNACLFRKKPEDMRRVGRSSCGPPRCRNRAAYSPLVAEPVAFYDPDVLKNKGRAEVDGLAMGPANAKAEGIRGARCQ